MNQAILSSSFALFITNQTMCRLTNASIFKVSAVLVVSVSQFGYFNVFFWASLFCNTQHLLQPIQFICAVCALSCLAFFY